MVRFIAQVIGESGLTATTLQSSADEEQGDEEPDDVRKDRDKYDAWDAQRGISRTEAKRRYIEALIETMHKYASTTA